MPQTNWSNIGMIENSLRKILLSWMVFLCFHIYAIAQSEKPIRTLIVDGFSNHDWKKTTLAIRGILEPTGLFLIEETTIPTDPAAREAWELDLRDFDLVIQNTNNIHDLSLKWPVAAQKALEEFVRKGGGLYILHSANNAFPDWEEYNKMIGLGWRSVQDGTAIEINPDTEELIYHPAGQGKGTNHGDRFDALIQIIKRHPINEGFPDAWKTKNTEVYSFPRGTAKDLTVLSFAYDSTDTHKNWPVEWVVNYGKGKVYNSSMGHLWHGETFPPAYQCVGFQTTLIRAAEWVATGVVSYPVPKNFPTATETSLTEVSGIQNE